MKPVYINISVGHCTITLREWVLKLKLTERDSFCYEAVSFSTCQGTSYILRIEPEGFSLFLHVTAIGPYPKPHESKPHPFILFITHISCHILWIVHRDTSWHIVTHRDTSWHIVIHRDTSWHIVTHRDT
jgi:hypothetical protein